MPADWSMLPSDPLCVIAMKFDAFDDFTYFSAVCQQWNRASTLVKHQWRAPSPSLLLAENTKQNPNHLRKIFDLNNNLFYQLELPETFGTRCWGSPYGWIAMADDNRNVQLFNPITKAQIHYPSLKTLTHYTDAIDEYYKDNYVFLRGYLIKLIVLKVSHNDHPEFVIMAIYNNNDYLDFARHGDETWTSIQTDEFEMDPSRRLFTKVIDVIAKNDDIFGLYRDGSIVRWHARDFFSGELLIPMVYSPPRAFEFVSRHFGTQVAKYLVECHGDLIMVVRYTEEIDCEDDPDELDCEIGYQTIDFDVFKLTKYNKWEKIKDLANVALFIGGNYSMSTSVSATKCLQNNRIYFTDDQVDFWASEREFGGHDTGFYDMERKEIEFYQYDDMRSLFCPSTWFTITF